MIECSKNNIENKYVSKQLKKHEIMIYTIEQIENISLSLIVCLTIRYNCIDFIVDY